MKLKYINTYRLYEEELQNKESKIPSNEELVKMLRKNFANYTKPGSSFPVEVKDNKGKVIKTLEFTFDDKGELQIEDDSKLSENKFAKALVGLCLVGGMLTSCKKSDSPKFGYNISSAPTSYTISPNGNKEIEIFNKDGNLQKFKVDSTTEETGSFGGNGLLFNRRMTPTEFYIIGAGKEFQSEMTLNNGKGSNPGSIRDVKSGNVHLSGGDGTKLYQTGDAGTPEGDPRVHNLWKLGIEALNKKGENTSSLIAKADKEVENGKWIIGDDDKRESEINDLLNNPITLDNSNYMKIFKSYSGKPEWQVASGKLGGSDALRLSKSYGDTKFKTFGIEVWQTANKKLENDVWVERAKITVTNTEKDKLVIYGMNTYNLTYNNGFWEYNNGTKLYKLKLVWDGKNLTMFENNDKIIAFIR